jgi:hypothetical protein
LHRYLSVLSLPLGTVWGKIWRAVRLGLGVWFCSRAGNRLCAALVALVVLKQAAIQWAAVEPSCRLRHEWERGQDLCQHPQTCCCALCVVRLSTGPGCPLLLPLKVTKEFCIRWTWYYLNPEDKQPLNWSPVCPAMHSTHGAHNLHCS